MNRSRTLVWPLLAIVLLLTLLVSPALAATSVVPDVWDPSQNPNPTWVNGNVAYYTEGEVAPVRLLISDVDGTVVNLSVCLDLDVSSNGHYAFTDTADWNTTVTPTETPPTPANLSAAIDGFRIENGTGTLNSVTFIGESTGDGDPTGPPHNTNFRCLEDYQEWVIEVTLPTDADGNDEEAVVVFGAKIARPGDPVRNGGFVPPGLGAGGVNGNFQFEIRNGGREAISFSANEAPSTLIVDKVTDPTGDPQLFDFNLTDNNGTDEDFQLADATTPEAFVLDPGDYTITEENIPANWDLDDITCDFNANAGSSVTYGDTDVDVTLAQGDTITCTFSNTYTPPPQTGTIIIVKDATPADDTAFTFTQNIDQSGNFILTDPADNTETFNNVAAGSFSVTEAVLAGWTLDDIVCVDPDLGTTVNVGQRTASIDLDPGETVTCTFENSEDPPPPQTGTIIIVKDATPADDTAFTFTQNIDQSGNFILTDPADNTETFNNVAAGSFSVTEAVLAGWTLDDIVCVDPDLGTTVNVGQRTASIDLDPGETVTCTFENSEDPPPPQTGTIIIVKDATPADDTAFTFTQNIDQSGNFILTDPTDNTETFSDVAPGTFIVTEQSVSGWALSGIRCDDANSTTNTGQRTATINVEAGETVTCTFENFKPLNLTSLCSPSEDVRSWRVTNPQDFNIDYEVQLQTTTDATPNRVAAPGFTFFETVSDGGANTTKIVYTDPFGRQQQVTKASNNQICPPPAGFCPTDDPAVGFELTDLVGRGMGGPTKAFKQAKYIFSDADEMVALYGQLTAVDIGVMKYVRFFDGTTTQINPPTSPAYRSWAVDWWGMELNPNRVIKGQFFTGKGAAKAPRGLVLWPTYGTGDAPYANVLTTFDESIENHVYWDTGWVPMQTQLIDIPETQTAGADITVKVALVDNQPDSRPVVMTVTPLPGGTPFELVMFGPNVPGRPAGWQNTLNLETIVLENVPAGVNQIEIKLTSPDPFDPTYQTDRTGGDSVAMIGAAVNYYCELEDSN
jgi:hypothetical protein